MDRPAPNGAQTPTGLPYHVSLAAASHVLRAIQQGSALDAALAHVSEPIQPSARALVSEALRLYGAAKWLLQSYVRKPLPEPVTALLQISLAQCPPLSTLRPPIKLRGVHTLFHQTSEALRQDPQLRKWRGLQNVVNGVLRNVQRHAAEHAAQLQAQSEGLALFQVLQLPAWWLHRLQSDWPEQWPLHVAHSNQAPALHVRVLAPARATLELQWQQAGIDYVALGLEGFWLTAHAPTPTQIPGFGAGLVSVQDGAAQLAAPLLCNTLRAIQAAEVSQPATPWRLLDACAAPGGKTIHCLQTLAQRGQAATVWALDQDPERLLRVHDNLQRVAPSLAQAADLQWQCHSANAAQPHTWWDGLAFDGILLDAPCTGSGVLRRHPDMPLLRRESDIAQLTRQQADLLTALWPCLRPGGLMLYATCSVFRAECEQQIEHFIAEHPDAMLAWEWRFWAGSQQQLSVGKELSSAQAALFAQSAQEIRDNPPHDHDGFYCALLYKTKT